MNKTLGLAGLISCVRDNRVRTGLSIALHHDRRAVSARRSVRHHHAADRRTDVEGTRAAGRGRERHRRWRHHRLGARRQGRARWLPVDLVRLRHARGDRIPAQGPALQTVGLGAHRLGQCLAGRSGCPQGRPGEHAAGVHRLPAHQREEGDRSRCRCRFDLQPCVFGVSIRSPASIRPSCPIAARRRRPRTWSPATSISAAIRSSTSCSMCRAVRSRPMPSPATSARRCCRTFRPRRRRGLPPSS